MRFREVFRFELGHQLRRPSTWLYFALLLGAVLLLVAGGANPPVSTRFNSPVKIATFTLFIGLLGTLVTAGLFVEAAHRDLRWRMDPLFYTAPVGRWDYLGGRFLGALLVNALLLLAVPAGLLLGTRLPAVSPDTLGPFQAGAYLLPYVVFLLPNLLVNAAVLFGVTLLSRRALPGYLGGLGLVAAYLVAVNATVGLDGSRGVALADPTGAVALAGLTDGWTRVEQNNRAIGLQGMLLWNRVLWTALGAGMLAFTWRRFRFAHAEPGSRRRSRRPETAPAAPERAVRHAGAFPVPAAPRSFGPRARARQALAVAGIAFRQIVLSREFPLILLGLLLFALLLGVGMMTDPMFGLPIWPLTQEVIADLTGRSMQILIALLTVFYAGELVWNERDAGIDRIGDSAPVPDWVPFVGRFLALGLLLAVLQAVLMAAGMLAQALQGYYAFEPALYLQALFGLQFADYLLLAVLALLVHVLVNDKYLGHLVAVLLFAGILQAGRLGLEHNLLVYGSDAGWVYSDLNGFGPFLEPFVWFKLYWAGWALLLGTAAVLFWIRGTDVGLRERLRLARQRFTRRVAAATAGAAVLVLATGGFIFYNTNVLNDYRTGREANAVDAEYERRYKRFEHVPQPWLTGMRLHAEIHPERREIAARGTYRLVNRADQPIDSIHVSSVPDPEITTRGIRFDRPARPVLEDPAHGYRIYTLEQALEPGDSMQMHFEVRVARRGFRNRERASANAPVVGDFTHVPRWLLVPAIGYQRELRELSSARARREHGLPPAAVQPSIHDPRARRIPRISPTADWIDFEATVGTARDHIAVLPGTLRRAWTEGDRRYFHYRADTPIVSSFGLLSAKYAVRRARWNGVDIRVLHHPGHAFNVERMVRNVQVSLDYFTEHFGAYPHRQFWMIEFPRYGTFGRAYPGQMVYSERHPISLARMDQEEATGLDGPLLVSAHEIAHQWWGQQVVGADVQGSRALSETLAQYSAVMVLERTYGAAAARRFLRIMHMAYLDGRGSPGTPEVPLLLTTDHEYIHYRKGAVVMYALRDYLGEGRVNTALRRLLRQHGMHGPPYPTTLDLHRELRAVTPDSLRYLLEDLLETITLWDLRATAARAEAAGDGEYRVTLDVDAAKLRSDSVGNHTEVPMNDLVDIGVFAPDGERLYLRKHRIRSGRQTITVTVKGTPARAGIDPDHTLITRHLEGLIGAKITDVEIDGARDSVDAGATRSTGQAARSTGAPVGIGRSTTGTPTRPGATGPVSASGLRGPARDGAAPRLGRVRAAQLVAQILERGVVRLAAGEAVPPLLTPIRDEDPLPLADPPFRQILVPPALALLGAERDPAVLERLELVLPGHALPPGVWGSIT